MASPLSLGVGYCFGEFQCLPVDDCSAVSCDSSALTRGSQRTSFYCTILNQSSICVLFDDSYSDRCEVTFHCGFHLHFPDDS